MLRIFTLLILIILSACQTSDSGGGGKTVVVGHTQVDNKFSLSTQLHKTYLAGETLQIYLTFPLPVVVTGSPKLTVTIGTSVVDADFVNVASNVLLFEYDVEATDFDNNGINIASTLNKNGGTIRYNGSEDTSTTIIVPNLSTVQVNGPSGSAPVAANITPAAFNEDTSTTVTLSYTDPDGDLASSCTVGGLNKVTVTTPCSCNGSGVCTVGITGALNQNGAAWFTYTVTASGLTSNTATASFTINPVADAPVANNITPPAFNEDTIRSITLSYSDGEGDLATSCTTSSLTNVTVTTPCACSLGVCTVSVQGTPNYSGAASFAYTVTANGQTSNTATASLTINAVGDAPVATNLTPPAFNEDTQSVITLSYTDNDSDLATLCSVSGLTNVSVTQPCACNGSGVCTVGVTGSANYSGAAGFSYTVTAGGQASNSASASFTINPVDDAPVAQNIAPAASVPKNTETVLTLIYTDVENDQATMCSTSALNNVTVTTPCSCAAGVCTVGVTGTPNYVGPAGFNYTVTANGLPSNSATASFTISGGTPPVADNLTPPAFDEDVQSIITLSYSDADSDVASTCTTSGLTNVTVTQPCACAVGVCTVGVTGTANFSGAAGFSYTVTAASDVSNTATASFTINPIDDAPVASNLNPPDINKNQQGIITLSYTDIEGDLAATCTVSGLSNITETQACACNGSGVCTVGVTGTLNYTGAASFSYTVTANGQASNSASATFNIISSPPVADNITPPAFNEDVQSIITLSYSDLDNDLATVCSAGGLTNVTVTQPCACDGSGVCTIGVTGSANYNGSASFTYNVTAGGVVSNSATATLTINPVDDAPVATNVTPPAFAKNTQSVITLAYTDVETDLATSCSVSGLTNVTVTQPCACSSGTCTVGVTGTTDYSGAAGFSYTVTANGLPSNSANASLTITNTPPVAANINPPLFNEDSQSIVTLSYSDVDGDLATACAVTSPTNVTVTQACACNGSGVCTVGVTGTANHFGAASFNYTVTAAGQASNSALASLSLNSVDDRPVGNVMNPPAFNEDTQSIITLSYTDVENDLANACTISAPTNVTVTQACACNASGVCTVGVTGTPHYYGAASFSFTVTANGQTSVAQNTSLTITSVPDAPTTANLTPPAFNEDTQSIITLTHTVVGGDTATACSVTSPTNVTVTQACACASGTCTVGVTGTPNYNGAASFTWTVSATSAQSVARTANLTITSVDDAASLGAIATQNTTVNTATSAIAFTFNDNDGAVCTTARLSMTSSNTTIVPNANVTFAGTAPNCTAVITPASNRAGTVTITFTATDGGLPNKTTSFTLNVNGAVLVWTNASGTIITDHDFGTPGTNTTEPVRIRNDGNQASGAITINDPGATPRVGVSTTSCAALNPTAFCSLNLTWTQNGGGGNGTKIETFTATHAGGSSSASITVQGTR